MAYLTHVADHVAVPHAYYSYKQLISAECVSLGYGIILNIYAQQLMWSTYEKQMCHNNLIYLQKHKNCKNMHVTTTTKSQNTKPRITETDSEKIWLRD